jgi:hypothetical protein
MMSIAPPCDHDGFPAVDDRLVEPEQYAEVFDGLLVPVVAAPRSHGERLALVTPMVIAHLVPEFTAATCMLTRVSKDSDVAPHLSVYPWARDSVTGGRQLQHLVFEIVDTETRRHAGRRAAKLVARGVHRVFAIDVERDHALEWSPPLGSWIQMGPDAVVDHPAFIVPVPMAPLVHEVRTDDMLMRALIAKRNPVILAAMAEASERARAEAFERARAEAFEQARAEAFEQARAEGRASS